jgi:hypothetical protein
VMHPHTLLGVAFVAFIVSLAAIKLANSNASVNKWILNSAGTAVSPATGSVLQAAGGS